MPRAAVDKAVEIRLLDDLSGRPVVAQLTNVSASGLGLRLNRPLARGREFVLLLRPDDPQSLRYRVVRCQPTRDGKFQIGAAFVRAPAAETKRNAAGDAKADPPAGGAAA